MFAPFVADEGVRLIGVEAGGTGEAGCQHSAAINLGRPGVLHGEYTMLLQDEDGQVLPSSSISAGLDYPGVGPEHAYLHQSGRVKYGIAYDHEALAAFQKLCRELYRPDMAKPLHLYGFTAIKNKIDIEHIIVYCKGHGIFHPGLDDVKVHVSCKIKQRRQIEGTRSERDIHAALSPLGGIQVSYDTRI
jgi:tryptophan synthase beta subunit